MPGRRDEGEWKGGILAPHCVEWIGSFACLGFDMGLRSIARHSNPGLDYDSDYDSTVTY